MESAIRESRSWCTTWAVKEAIDAGETRIGRYVRCIPSQFACWIRTAKDAQVSEGLGNTQGEQRCSRLTKDI